MSAPPPHYVNSEFHDPGAMSSVGMVAFSIVVIVGLCILAIIGSRFLLKRSRHLNPTVRRILRAISGLTKPAAPLSFGRRRQHRIGTRRKDESHYRMRAAVATDAPAPPTGATPSAALRATQRQVLERPAPRRRPALDLAVTPEEHWPFFGEDEIAAVVDVLRSGKVNQWTGSKVFEFEQAYTRHLRNGRAIALANGSVALELALRALRIGPGDEVIVTPRSFVASAFCVRLVGATPVFAEVDPDSGNLTADAIEAAITPRTRAVIPVHLAGWPAAMPAIMSLARARDILVVEDCAQAHGAEIDGLPVGSFGDAAIFSFCQDKIISTGGEGGLLNLRDDKAYEWAWSFKDHGKDRLRALDQPTRPGFRWLHDRVGTNWRMIEIEAAIGLLQLEKLPQWRMRRTRNADSWAEALRPIAGLRVPMPSRNVTGAFYKYYAYVDVDPAENGRLRDRVLEATGAAGLRVFSGSCSEMYREAAFADMAVATLPIAHALGDSSLMFEVHPTLDPRRLRDRADAVAQIIRDVLEQEAPGRT